jgi:DNA modification methylase
MSVSVFFETKLGTIFHGDSLELMRESIPDSSVELIVTSPPFGLVRKKSYGNVDAEDYVDWFRPFGKEFLRILKPNGSLVIDIGGSWIPGQPTRSLYHFELLIMLCRQVGFHLAQEFFWWSPSKLPSPAEWVTVGRVRVKDAVDCVWWLSPSPWPKASHGCALAVLADDMAGLTA